MYVPQHNPATYPTLFLYYAGLYTRTPWKHGPHFLPKMISPLWLKSSGSEETIEANRHESPSIVPQNIPILFHESSFLVGQLTKSSSQIHQIVIPLGIYPGYPILDGEFPIFYMISLHGHPIFEELDIFFGRFVPCLRQWVYFMVIYLC